MDGIDCIVIHYTLSLLYEIIYPVNPFNGFVILKDPKCCSFKTNTGELIMFVKRLGKLGLMQFLAVHLRNSPKNISLDWKTYQNLQYANGLCTENLIFKPSQCWTEKLMLDIERESVLIFSVVKLREI